MPKKSANKSKPKKTRQQPVKKSAASQPAASQAGTQKVAGVWRILASAGNILIRNWKLFGGLLIVYVIVYLILVGGVSNGNLDDIKDSINQTFNGSADKLTIGVGVFAFLVSSSVTAANTGTGAYQTMMIILFSVVIVWALRQAYLGKIVRIRDAFYSGVYPLVPFILVLIVLGLQMIPIALGAGIYTVVIGGGIAVTGLEQALFGILAILLAILSIYMLLSSIFALYIVTLPDMAPIKALRSAREIVRARRPTVLWKLVFLAIVLIVVVSVVMIPISVFATPIATAALFILALLALVFTHSYIYTLYRELIK